ncbi:hypothetical protein [uncultured Brevibacillus sp.]|uniref:hypothetical protein n=1 Tax=uncultured Brevibacillus sp. TaxID=169970 RepID=UPI002599E281|nr:hypothetical protein [uncultured Brevibacillus sp.]
MKNVLLEEFSPICRARHLSRFYILPDPAYKQSVKQRMEDILNQQNPTFVVPSTI